MALLVYIDGTQEQVKVPTGNEQLAFLQGCVGGNIEFVPVLDQKTLDRGYVHVICDEEGKLKEKEVNPSATVMAGRDGTHEFFDPLAGDCLFCTEDEIQ